jgi:HlyD family secretion protein
VLPRLLWIGMGLVATLVVIWQASQAGWIRPPGPLSAPAPTRPATEAPNDSRRRPDSVIAEGRLVTYPGAEVVIAAELAGKIISLPVREKSVVRKGDSIAELNSEELRAWRDEASARIEEAEAEIRFFDREVSRTKGLIARRAASDVELDINERGRDTARARRQAAIASQRRCDALIAKTRINAPIDGVITARFVQPGETVDIGTRLVTIVDLKRVRIEAEVDEFDIGGITLGADVRVFAEGFPGLTWRGQVEEVPDAVVGRHLRPEDTARPVDTRVLLVKIALLESTPLKLGQRIEVEIVKVRR